jgi:hypothetical protein
MDATKIILFTNILKLKYADCCSCCSSCRWSKCVWTAATSRPVLFMSQVIATLERYWQGEAEELKRKPVLVPGCAPQIPYGLTRAWTQVSVVRALYFLRLVFLYLFANVNVNDAIKLLLWDAWSLISTNNNCLSLPVNYTKRENAAWRALRP